MHKFTYRQFIMFLLVSVAISHAGAVYADSGIAANGQSAQARVNFNIVIAPSLALNMGQLATDSQMTSPSGINPNNPSAPVGNNTPPPNSSSHGQYVLADASETGSMGFRQNGFQYLILSSP